MLFSNIDVSNFDDVSNDSVLINDSFVEELKEIGINSNFNKFNKEKYRNKINKLYYEIEGIKPIDNLINDVIYFDDYEEVGLVLNKKDVSLKQIWTEYRLIYNEKIKEDDSVENSFVLDNFDDLFDKISKKVDGLDKYINDLTSLKREIDNNNMRLDANKESFELEKIGFENYRRSEIARLEKLEKELNYKMDKINGIMKNIEEKMNFISN